MRKITSITTFDTAAGKRISITYSEIDSAGKITDDNIRVNRIVVDESAIEQIEAVESYAQTLIEGGN